MCYIVIEENYIVIMIINVSCQMRTTYAYKEPHSCLHVSCPTGSKSTVQGNWSLQTEEKRGEKKQQTHLFNGLSLCPLLLFQSLFLSPPLGCGRGTHCQEVKGHPFVSLGNRDKETKKRKDV